MDFVSSTIQVPFCEEKSVQLVRINTLKGNLDSILSVKFKLWAGKFASSKKAKHCWALSTNF